MTYNSKVVTRIMGCFQSLKVFNVMSLKERQLLFGSSGKGDQAVFEVVIKTHNKTKRISLQSTKGQAELTAFSAVLHVEKLLSKKIAKGIYFSHQIHSSEEIYEELTSYSTINIKIS